MNRMVYFLDIDDCLIKTSALLPSHLSAVENTLRKFSIKRAKEITHEFASTFHILYDLHQGKKVTKHQHQLQEEYMNSLRNLEKPVIEKYGEVKRWSREVGIYLAAKKYEITLSNSNLTDISDILWYKIMQSAIFYSDSLQFLTYLIDQKIPFYLITSSDSRLTLDDTTGVFHYNPDYSRELKYRRMKILYDIGIPREHIFIGDPYDKPKSWVFEQAMNKAKLDIKKPFQSVMVGDSLTNDLLPAQKAGMDTLIFLNRSAKIKRRTSKDGIIIVNSLRLAILD